MTGMHLFYLCLFYHALVASISTQSQTHFIDHFSSVQIWKGKGSLIQQYFKEQIVLSLNLGSKVDPIA